MAKFGKATRKTKLDRRQVGHHGTVHVGRASRNSC